MKQTLYQMLLPRPLREKIYEADVRRYQAEQYQERLRIEKALPRPELSPVYIAKLRILADRYALLNELPKRAIVAEIGARAGELSDNILQIADPEQITLIDLWPEQGTSDETMRIVANKFKKEIADGRLLLNRATPLSALASYDDGYFDWVYINSDPSYEATAATLDLCREKVKKSGIIAGNNYMTCSWIDMVRFGVIEAVHEFCKKRRWEMIFLTHESHRSLSYALSRINP